MDATRSTGYFDGGCAKAELSYRDAAFVSSAFFDAGHEERLQKRPRDAPARRRDHRRPAIRDRCDEPLAQQETLTLTLKRPAQSKVVKMMVSSVGTKVAGVGTSD